MPFLVLLEKEKESKSNSTSLSKEGACKAQLTTYHVWWNGKPSLQLFLRKNCLEWRGISRSSSTVQRNGTPYCRFFLTDPLTHHSIKRQCLSLRGFSKQKQDSSFCEVEEETIASFHSFLTHFLSGECLNPLLFLFATDALTTNDSYR